MTPSVAWNTAASFVTNTNWQSYSGEATMSVLTQMVGLTVQNFISAAVGMSVAIALVRGFIRFRTDRLGNFWVDVTRTTLRILLPLSIVAALLLLAMGWCRTCTRSPTSPPSPAASSPSRAERSPARRPSRSSATTAAARSTPTPRTRTRTPHP